MVEHPASRGVCFADASAFNGNDHAGRHAAYGFGILDVYGGGCTNARALHHSGARTPCRLVRRIEGGKAMNWTSPAEFFAMGGYGQYVWGSVGVAIVVLCAAWLLLRQRSRAALFQLKRQLILKNRESQ